MASISIGDSWNINRLVELCQRCGVKPTIADIFVEFHDDDPSAFCSLSATGGGASNDEEEKRVKHVWKLLGLDETGYRLIKSPTEMDAIIDHALSMAPRVHHR